MEGGKKSDLYRSETAYSRLIKDRRKETKQRHTRHLQCTDLKQRIVASLKTDVKRQSKDIHVIYNDSCMTYTSFTMTPACIDTSTFTEAHVSS